MANEAEVAVVGAGIIGLAFAWEAARRGHSVVVFDRSSRSQGASVRNFGMIWPIGQVPGADYQRAMRSRERWLELRDEAGVVVETCGSLHLAYEADEDALLQEFAGRGPSSGVACTYLSPAETLQRFPAVNPERLRGSLHSPTELAIDPPEAIGRIQRFLTECHGVILRLGSTVVDIEMPHVHAASGEVWRVQRAFVCSGADFETLFPRVFESSGIRRCKLQMMKTRPQPAGWRMGSHMAGGLTLCHYRSFADCSTLPALHERVKTTMPEYVRHGIHVMAAQNDRGEVVIGDSHEYDHDISIFDKTEIDDLILRYLRTMVCLPDWSILTRWHGIYAKHPSQTFVYAEPQPHCLIATAPGGAGMTLGFGLAREWWEAWDRQFSSPS